MSNNILKLTMNEAKSYFNPRPAISNAERVEMRFLRRYGAFVRQEAKSSIRKRKAASQPGSPPSSHEGSLKRNIVFVVDRSTSNVWIFPTVFRSSRDTPGTLEKGGRVRIPKPLVRYRTRAGRYIDPRKHRPPKTAERVVVQPGSHAVASRPYMEPAKRRVDPQVSGIWAYARN